MSERTISQPMLSSIADGSIPEHAYACAPVPETGRKFLHEWIPSGTFFTLPIVALHVGLGTVIWQQLMQPGSSVGDAFYFAVETFLTIGYGDITPASNTAKAFFIFFTVLSLVVQLTVLSAFVSNTLSSMDPSHRQAPSTAPHGEVLTSFFRIRPRIIKALRGFGLLLCLVTAGACMLKFTESEEGLQLSWLDCWYWSVTTISTVGYGDIAPTKLRPLFAIFFLVAVVLFAHVLGESVALVSELGNYRRMAELFEKGLQPDAIDKMDCYNQDGRVSRVEFLMFMLEHLGMMDRAEMEQIMTLFEACDDNSDGVLDLQDVKTRLHSCSIRRAVSTLSVRQASGMSRAAAAAIASIERGHSTMSSISEVSADLRGAHPTIVTRDPSH